MRRPLRVLLNLDLPVGGWCGGIEQFVSGLVWGLAELDDGPEQYLLLVGEENSDWLKHRLGSNQQIVSNKPPLDRAKALLGGLRRPAGRLWRGARRLLSGSAEGAGAGPAVSDRFLGSLNVQLVHFPFQKFWPCGVPSIFNPHDLLHLHFPEFLTQDDLEWRRLTYLPACLQASAVVAESRAVRKDLVTKFGLDARKIHVINRASPTALYTPITEQTLAALPQRLRLPDLFALFPAQTWPHKNHIRLLEAIALLRDHHGVKLSLVCTGRQNDWWPMIEKRIQELGLSEQAQFLGYVAAADLLALYRLAWFVAFPSLFEGGGFPVLEAFQEGAPVACSGIAPLREYGGSAILEFDPRSVTSIAGALRRMMEEPDLLSRLRREGTERARQYTWGKTARKYRALYRFVGGGEVSEEDKALLMYEEEATITS